MESNQNNFINEYLNWLKKNMKAEQIIDTNILEVTTPFLDRNNDYTQIYIIESDEGLLLTDMGYIISELEMLGLDLNTKKRKEILNTIVNRFGVDIDSENHLYLETTRMNYPQAKHDLIQAMLAVDDMFYLSRSNVISIFSEEVCSFFKENEIFYTPDVKFQGEAGYVHSYDFALQENKNNPERLIRLANNLSKSMTESILFSWNDTKNKRKKNSELFTIINDKNSYSQSDINALRNYDVETILWSERYNYLEKLG